MATLYTKRLTLAECLQRFVPEKHRAWELDRAKFERVRQTTMKALLDEAAKGGIDLVTPRSVGTQKVP